MVTEMQKQTIGLVLQGKDVLGDAKTGSGKIWLFFFQCQKSYNTYSGLQQMVWEF